MPGISLESIESLADSEQRDYLGVWNDVVKRAQRKFIIDVTAEFSKRYQINQIAQSIDLGKIIDTTVTTTAAAEYRGIYIDLDWPLNSDQYKTSALQSHYVQTISFYSPAIAANQAFKFWDFDTNTVVGTFTQTLAVGWNYITVNTNYPYRRIIVATDHSTFNAVELTLPSSLDCCTRFEGVKFGLSADVRTVDRGGKNTYGMSLVYSVRCSYETIICNNLDAFTSPWLYLLCSELTVERQYSPRINRWTLKQKEAEELKAYYDVEYQKSLALVVGSTKLDLSDACLACDATYNVKESPFH